MKNFNPKRMIENLYGKIFLSVPIFIKFEIQTLKNISLNTCFVVFKNSSPKGSNKGLKVYMEKSLN